MRKTIIVIIFLIFIYYLIKYYTSNNLCPKPKIKYKFISDIFQKEDPLKHPIVKMSQLPDNMFQRNPILW